MTKKTYTLDLGPDWSARLETLAAQSTYDKDVAHFASLLLIGAIEAAEKQRDADMEQLERDYEANPDEFGQGIKEDEPLDGDLKDGIPV